MKYISILLFIILLGSCQIAEEDTRIQFDQAEIKIPLVTYDMTDVVFNKKNSKWQFQNNGELVSGYIVEKFKHGQFSKQFAVYEGKKEGILSAYFPNGQLRFEEHYKSNKLHGEVKRWSQQYGYQLIAQLSYMEGKLHGEQKKWFATGELHKRMHMKEGKEDGLQQAFRKNGVLYANYEAKNGRMFGLKRSNLCYELDNEQVVYKD